MDNQEINTKDLLGIGLVFKTNEKMSIPIEVIDIHKIDNNELNISIGYSEKISYDGSYVELTALQRIHKLDDITSINLIYKDNNIEYLPLWWDNPNPYIDEPNNKYQTSELSAHASMLHLEISKDVLKRKIQLIKNQAAELLQQAEELELSIT